MSAVSLTKPHCLVAKLAQLLPHAEALGERIGESRRLVERRWQTALREALGGPGGGEPQPKRPQRPGPAVGMMGDLFAGVR